MIAAHSMGGVLAVSALGVLASSPSTRPVLARVGLLTPTVAKKYEEAGIPLHADPRVLHAMEGGNPIAA